MRKDEPIIFKLYNSHDEYRKFKLPYRKDLLVERDDGKIHVVVDIKANTKWYKDIIPDEFEIHLAPKQSMTILIKPHNDNYFAGWGRWFNWGAEFDEKCSWWWEKIKPYQEARNKMLTAVLSDPDYAHLQSETKIGDNFRNEQYDDRSLPRFIESLQKCDAEFIEILFENNSWIFKHICDDLKTMEICKIAVKKDKNAVNYVPKRFMTEEFWEMATKNEIYSNEILTQEDIDTLLTVAE